MRTWAKIARWLGAYGFALLVLLAIGAAALLALSEPMAKNPPLVGDSEPLYRLLLFIAALTVFYLSELALVLALRGRAFTELGPRGVKVNRVLSKKHQQALRHQEGAVEGVKRELKQMSLLTEAIVEELAALRREVRGMREDRKLDSES